MGKFCPPAGWLAVWPFDNDLRFSESGGIADFARNLLSLNSGGAGFSAEPHRSGKESNPMKIHDRGNFLERVLAERPAEAATAPRRSFGEILQNTLDETAAAEHAAAPAGAGIAIQIPPVAPLSIPAVTPRVEGFLDLLEGRPDPRVVTLREGLEVVALAEATLASAASGEAVAPVAG